MKFKFKTLLVATLATLNVYSAQSQQNSLPAILENVSKIKVMYGYRAVGSLNIDTLTYTRCGFGDIMHYFFRDKTGFEFDFGFNSTDLQLEVQTDDGYVNGGYATNKLYFNKKFLVIWRQLEMTKEPEDFMDEYYKQTKEIIYLKRL